MHASERSYLDHNATVPLRDEVAEAMVRAFRLFGNPSSIHAEGRAARAAIEAARGQVARLVGADPRNVAFTSGGTEAANTVLSPSLTRGGVRPDRLLVGATEHPCVANGHRFPPGAVEILAVDDDGAIDLDRLAARLDRAEGSQMLVSVQAANNETGVVQPLAPVADCVRAAGGFTHSDAVQAAGRVPVDLIALGLDVLTLSAHKLGGPKGVGAIAFAAGVDAAGRLVRGGGQERGRRAGTENVAGVVGFGVAAEIALRDLAAEAERLTALRGRFESAIRDAAPDAVIFSERAVRLPNTIAFAIPGLRAETALIAFDLDGVAVSSGSACSSGKVSRSHVLAAMGVDPALADGAIRVSLGWNTGEADLARFSGVLQRFVETLSLRRRANAA